jgi:tetratricopeptide (TPR) repeat protein
MDITTLIGLVVGVIGAIAGIIAAMYTVKQYRLAHHTTKVAPPPTPAAITDSKIDISRLPRPSSAELVGRSSELRQLTTALKNESRHLVHIYAGGGVGKSALILTWLQNMHPDYHKVDKIFAWSFYSQGSHDTQNSSVPFFQVALPFFGFTGEWPKEDVAKGRALARCVRDKSFILVLDGLEPLQHPAHILDGELKDVAIKAFLEEVLQYHGLTQPTSLIVISSRQRLTEAEAWPTERYVVIDLQTLPKTDGAKLLAKLGVTGTTEGLQQEELEQASEEWGGHALALVLLGKLLNTQFAGKIRRRDQLPSLWTDARLGGHTLRVLRWYEDHWKMPWWVAFWLKTPLAKFVWHLESKERVFLGLLGLFDRPMNREELAILLKQAKYASPLRILNEVGWHQLEKKLEQAGLLLPSDGHRTQWDCHPLIRSYFGQRFKETRLSQYQQAHRILFEYYQSDPSKRYPDTIAELEPLYRAVVHGCLAGEYQKALEEVYWERILRGEEQYSLHKLGAYSQDLTALAAFFPHGWSHPVQHGLTEADQAWLLAEASFCLMSLGRLGEAVAPREVSLEMAVKQQDWKNASIYAQNLIDLSLPLGQLAKAATVARQAIQYAEQSGDLFMQMRNHASLATTLHRQGQLDLAQQSFQRAEQLQQEYDPEHPQLCSLSGFQYCALLLDQAQSVAEFEAVLGRGEYSLKIGIANNHLLTIALDHLTLARVLTQLQRDDEASASFDQAVTGIRKAGRIDHLAYFLIDRANFHLRLSRLNLETAAQDLQEADSLIRRSGMKLYAVDCQLAWCRYYLAREEKETARQYWEGAKKGMEEMGYRLRAGEVRALGEDCGISGG